MSRTRHPTYRQRVEGVIPRKNRRRAKTRLTKDPTYWMKDTLGPKNEGNKKAGVCGGYKEARKANKLMKARGKRRARRTGKL